MILVKLGGSIITNKETFKDTKGKRIFYRNRTGRLIGEIGSTKEDFILVHGAGSFGHPLAMKYKLKKGYKNERQVPIVSRVQRDVRMLNFNVIQTMEDRGIHAVSLAPNTLVRLNRGKLKDIDMQPFHQHLKMKTVPVTFGDVVPDISRRFGICSGDDLMLHLAKEFKPRMAIFVTKVDGIFTRDPDSRSGPPGEFMHEINEKTIKLIQDSKKGVPDVTGRMKRKARMMLKIAKGGVDCIVLNGLERDRLIRAIRGDQVKCTIARRSR